MHPHDSDELADRIEEQFVTSVQYGCGVAVVEQRGSRRRIYALEVHIEGAEHDVTKRATIDVSGTEVELPLDQLRSVVLTARSGCNSLPRGQLEGRTHRRELETVT